MKERMSNDPAPVSGVVTGGRAPLRVSARVCVVLGALAVGLLLAEAGLRVGGFSYHNLYTEDPEVGFALRPGAEGWWRGEGVETYVRVNSQGLRDREHAKEKPPGTLRVAVLGDSYAEALQVPAADAFWSVAERGLQGCAAAGGRRVEFINFGVSGFSTARELITLRRRVWQYAPDVVVLLMTTGNDIRDNSQRLSRGYAGLPLPYFVYRDGALTLDDSLLKSRNESRGFRLRQSSLGGAAMWLREHLRLFDLFYKARDAFQTSKLKRADAPAGAGHEPGMDDKVYLEPTDADWAEAWRVTEGLLLLMRGEVEARGAKFLVVTGSNPVQVHPDASVRERFRRGVGAADLLYPDRRIRALGEREGFDVLSLAPPLLEYAERSGSFLHGADGSGHWNSAGHRVAGDLVAGRLCETLTHDR